MMALYANEGNGLFIDEAPASAIGRASLLTLTFGCFFFDYDLDGRLDIFAANGHVADDISTRAADESPTPQRPHLFRNLGRKQFEDGRPRAPARRFSSRSWRAAPPTATSTTTAISIC